MKTLNPRVELWLLCVGLLPADIERKDGRVARVTARGESNLWTVLYVTWVQEQWRCWAAHHGYSDARMARANGHNDFDAWLARRVIANEA